MADGSATLEAVDIREIVALGAGDSNFYAKFWFPKVARQEFADFHVEIDDFIEGPGRLKCLQVFRDGGKTTKARFIISKRIAYGLSRTILVVGKSERHSRFTLKWLRNQVDFNRRWANAFHLSRGKTWTDVELQIIQQLPGEEPTLITVVGMGITGSVRGINIDSFRPDFILLDDVLDEENSATPENRKKYEDLIYGAIINSLAPASENPNAMLLALQTPLDKEDYSVKAEFDPDWKFKRFAVWTEATIGLSLEEQESRWPARWPSEEMRQKKLGFIRRNKLSTWMREYECQVTAPELASFRAEWLQPWTILPKFLTHILVIDPVPPPSPAQLAAGNVKKDYEAFAAIGGYGGKYYVREVTGNRGHEPNWTLAEFWRLVKKYRPQYVIVEQVAYQRTLAWLLRQSMQKLGVYVPIQEFPGGMSKYSRITDGLSGVTSEHSLLIPPHYHPEGIDNSEGMRMFVQQFGAYPFVSHDDHLEAVAVGIGAITNKILLGDEHALDQEEAREQEEERLGSRTRAGALAMDRPRSLCP